MSETLRPGDGASAMEALRKIITEWDRFCAEELQTDEGLEQSIEAARALLSHPAPTTHATDDALRRCLQIAWFALREYEGYLPDPERVDTRGDVNTRLMFIKDERAKLREIERCIPAQPAPTGKPEPVATLPWRAVHDVLSPDEEGNARSFIRPIHSEGYQIAQTVGPNGREHADFIVKVANAYFAPASNPQEADSVTSTDKVKP
jgi:hypothetical protein